MIPERIKYRLSLTKKIIFKHILHKHYMFVNINNDHQLLNKYIFLYLDWRSHER